MQINHTREVKNALRKKFRAIRLGYSQEEKQRLDDSIFCRLTALYQYQKTDTLLTYVSKAEEPDTLQLISKAFRDGKKVAVPKCLDDSGKMAFYYITDLHQLEKSSFGVMEPKPAECREFIGDGSGSLCIVPGMAFDSSGYRLGYGKGYYDRFLSGYQGFTVGVCYSECVKWSLPKGRFDKPVKILVTDKYFRKIRNPQG